MVSAIYPGSFDPVTRGHLDLIERALPLFDRLTVAVAANSTKTATFTPEERVEMLREVLPKDKRLSVTSFRGLVVDFCKSRASARCCAACARSRTSNTSIRWPSRTGTWRPASRPCS
jgi:pantetheine-phosphate adenylyltransferase